MEQELRKQAIKRYRDIEKPKSIYTDLNRSKYWFYKWLKRHQSGEADWYKDQHPDLRADGQQRSARSTNNGSSLPDNVLSHKNSLKLVPQRSNGD